MPRRRYKYLRQLATTVMIALFVPVILYFSYFWRTSTDKMNQENQSRYRNQTEVFRSQFNEVLSELCKQSMVISVGSKNTDSGFYRGSEDFVRNGYGLFEAMLEMRELYASWGWSKSVEPGIYYYDIDRILTCEGTRTADNYIWHLTGTEEDSELNKIFSWEAYEPSKMLFGTTNTKERTDGDMLMGYCTTLGKNSEPVLIFYIISEDMFLDFLKLAYTDGWSDFCIMEKETGQIYLALYLSGSEEKTADSWHVEATTYRDDGSLLPFDFVVRIAEDSFQNDILTFRNTMFRLLCFTVLALMAICTAVLYINYRPVYRMVKDIDSGGEDEFQAVRMALDSRSSRIEEQEMLILDFLMNRLLRGIPIPEEQIRHFDITSDMKYYQVYVLEGGILLSGDTKRLVHEMKQSLGARIFVTDWQEGEKNILIVFMPKPDGKAAEAFLRRYFEVPLEQGYQLHAGKMVENMDDIRNSFLSCIKKNGLKKREKEEDSRAKMKDEILAYLEVHYRDVELSQSRVADEFGISVYSLSRMFKNQVGIGFVEYVNYKRMEYAKELLLTTDYPVKTIALMSGFTNDNYFSKYFKNIVGTSPTFFREQ